MKRRVTSSKKDKKKKNKIIQQEDDTRMVRHLHAYSEMLPSHFSSAPREAQITLLLAMDNMWKSIHDATPQLRITSHLDEERSMKAREVFIKKRSKGSIPETPFETFMYDKFPLERDPTPAQLADYLRYEGQDSKYVKEDENKKEKERHFLMAFFLVVITYTTSANENFWIFILDSMKMHMTDLILKCYLKYLRAGGIHITNPAVGEMVLQDDCPHNKYAKAGAPFAMFSAEASEYFAAIPKHLVPHYALMWIDTCCKPREHHTQMFNDIFRLWCFRTDAPSVLAVTFSIRDKDNTRAKGKTTWNNAYMMDAELTTMALKYGGQLVRPQCMSLPITKNHMYTWVYCVFPRSWKSASHDVKAEVLEKIDAAVASNTWSSLNKQK